MTPRGSLSQALNGHRNSLGVIRLVLATAVIFSHAFPLGGWGHDPVVIFTRGQDNLGGLAVLGFFAISGYLITKSGMNSDVVQYFWRRVLRIFPALWLVILVTAAGVGPIAWMSMGRPLAEYWVRAPGGPFHYVWSNATLQGGPFGIFDIFVTNTPYGVETSSSVFNGSLWTLAYEWGCYVMIGALVLVMALRFAKWVVPLATLGFVGIALIARFRPEPLFAAFPYFADRYHIDLTLIFLWGACAALYGKRIPMRHWMGILAGVLALVAALTGWLNLFGYPAAAYFIFYLASALPKSWQWIGAKNDYSYGMYLYGFLTQQVTASLGWHHLGYPLWTALCVLIAFGCAWISWHGLEKWAMRLKDWGPGRGIRYWFDRLRSPFVGTGERTEVANATRSV
ncbi:acyltransferase family protein [Mycetocola saprophilus]|uniref:acyltransferase family protein n=1 Tax=Mycetocola saprophilus TaxID=76636 RepID=UPI0006948000|nr:acyltransferase [Mycetocola saprophilus]